MTQHCSRYWLSIIFVAGILEAISVGIWFVSDLGKGKFLTGVYDSHCWLSWELVVLVTNYLVLHHDTFNVVLIDTGLTSLSNATGVCLD